MGDPRKLRKKFRRPLVPFEKARMDAELKYLGEYGLRNKTEFWKARAQLSKFRRIARDLKTMPENQQKIAFTELMTRLQSLGLVGKDSTTDDVLSLSVENILDRRLQTLVFKKGLARSIYQARQLVAHKHISVRDKVIASPSYLVKADEEAQLGFNNYSPFSGGKQKIFGDKSKPATEEPKERAPRKRSTRKKTTRPTKKSTRPTKKSTKKTGKKSSSSKE
ncbi:MAG: 30S ribosomal protein S4 [Promethearchaeota archaeon]